MLTEEQSEQIKKQLLEQIENFPEEKREDAKRQILSMNHEQLENFLKENNLIKNDSSPNNQCIFCSIISGDSPSYKIGENEKAIAVLEINPISKGHIIIIPKEHDLEEIDEETKNLSKIISEKIKEKLSPKEVKLFATRILGHKIINVLPIYENENSQSERKKATENELKELQEILTKEPEEEQNVEEPENKNIEEKEPEINEENTWLPIRIP